MLLVGDYNMIPDQDGETFVAISPCDYLRFISPHEAELPFTNTNGNFLDGYAISRRRMTEYSRAASGCTRSGVCTSER